MERHRAHFPKDEQPLADGDDGFIGVKNDEHPAILPPGFVWDAFNTRFTDKEAGSRYGVAKLNWSNRVTTSSNLPYPFGNVRGAASFRDPNDVEWMIIAAEGRVYRTREGNAAVPLNLPTGLVVDEDVQFEQTFDGLLMFRGAGQDDLIMDDLDEGFKYVVQRANTISGAGSENPTDGTETIPNADNGTWIGNRLFIPFESSSDGKDLLAISDYLNVTRYQPVRAQARINQGSSDGLLRFFKFSETTGIAFKGETIYALYNIQSALTSMYLDSVSSEIGLAGRYSVAQVGEDQDEKVDQVWFLSNRKGIFQLRIGDNGRVQVGSVPVSKDIEGYMKRIDWSNADLSRAAYFDNKFFLAVPLDDSSFWQQVNLGLIGDQASYFPTPYKDAITEPGKRYRWVKGANESSLVNGTETLTVSGEFTAQEVTVRVNGTGGQAVTATLEKQLGPCNNAILVFDFIRGRWAGIDTGRSICVKEFLTHTYFGSRRLFFVSNDGFINLMEELFFDEDSKVGGAEVGIGAAYNSGGEVSFTVEEGSRYYYKLGANDTSIVNGSQVLTDAQGVFTAASSMIVFRGSASVAVTVTLAKEEYELTTGAIGYDVTSRGYRCGNNGRKRFKRMEVTAAMWNPVINLYSVNEGQLEQTPIVTGLSKSPTKYDRPAWKEAWDQTNWNDDHATKHRQDYSVTLSQVAIPNFLGVSAGSRYYVEDLEDGLGIFYNNTYLPHGSYFIHSDETIEAWDDATQPFRLRGFWKLEEATAATTYADGSINGNDLAQTGTVEQVAGRVAGTFAARFQAGDKLSVADDPNLRGSGERFQFGGWLYFDDVATDQQPIGKGVYGSGSEEYGIILEGGTKQLKAFANNSGSQTVVNSGVTPNAGQWYFVTATIYQPLGGAGGTISIRVDDGSEVSAAHTVGVPSGSNDFQIGEDGGTYDFKGRADEVFIWSHISGLAGQGPANVHLGMFNSGSGIVMPPVVNAVIVAVYPPGSYLVVGENGVEPERHQDWQENRRLPHNSRGKYIQLRIQATQGRVLLQNTYVDAHPLNRHAGSKE